MTFFGSIVDGLVSHIQQALAKGTSIPSAGSVKLSWHNDASLGKTGSAQSTMTSSPQIERRPEERALSPGPEDNTEESGWGNEEDGMGMF